MARDYAELIPSANNRAPKFTAMVEAVAGAWGGVFDALQALPPAFDLDAAEGAQLDAVGLWVGQSRLIENVLTIPFFGFDGVPNSQPFGEEGNLAVGGRFYDEGEPAAATSVLADPEYRTLIRARIVRNNAQGTTADFVRALDFLFTTECLVDDPGTMAIGVSIGRPLTLVEQAIVSGLDILPRPAGVRIAWVIFFDGDFFGFEGQVNAFGFAEETAFLLDGSRTLDGSWALGFSEITGGAPFAEEFY